MASRVTDAEENRFVLPPGLFKSFFVPRVPVHRIMLVLQQVRGLLAREPIRVRVRSGVRFHGHRGLRAGGISLPELEANPNAGGGQRRDQSEFPQPGHTPPYAEDSAG